MKKFYIIFTISLIIGTLTGCQQTRKTPESFATAEEVIAYMEEGNDIFVDSGKNSGDMSAQRREDTAQNGQAPYAVVITCSDSRVPAEHIFSAGIGDLFVIRTAGNVVGDFELGSVEYGVEHLGCKLVVVLGHTNCGAIDAALKGGAHGNIEKITDEILSCLPQGATAREAEVINVQNSVAKIKASAIMQRIINENKVDIRGAIYDITSGEVSFLEP